MDNRQERARKDMTYTIEHTTTNPPRTVTPSLIGRILGAVGGGDSAPAANRTITVTGASADGAAPVGYVVAMRDTDGGVTWYRITRSWYDWANAPWDGSCPDDLAAAHATAGSGIGPASDFSHHTRQHLAVDTNRIDADDVGDLVAASAAGTVIYELSGTWY